MELNEVILTIGTGLISTAGVLTGFWLWSARAAEKEQQKVMADMRRMSKDTLLPLRLQAHERCVLFLERISPQHLIQRADGTQKTVRVFQTQLIAEIRAEYEHNLTQQLYVSEEAWAQLIRAKEETIGIIHRCAGRLSADASGLELGKLIIETCQQLEQPPAGIAIRTLRKDMKALF